MENEKEIAKLINVLRQIRHSLNFAGKRGENSANTGFCLQQYNNIVSRISELEPSVNTLFTPLPDNTSVKTLHFAVSELIAYLADEESAEAERPQMHHHGCGSWRERHHRRHCGKRRWVFGFGFRPSVERF